MIKSCSAQSSLEVIVLRPTGASNVAVKEVTQFPLLLDDMVRKSIKFLYNNFHAYFVLKKGLKTVLVHPNWNYIIE
jgi:hypothetical protein